jgi:hypothetical protein
MRSRSVGFVFDGPGLGFCKTVSAGRLELEKLQSS